MILLNFYAENARYKLTAEMAKSKRPPIRMIRAFSFLNDSHFERLLSSLIQNTDLEYK